MAGVLLTLDAFKLFMGITGTAQDAKLSAVVDGAAAAAMSFMERKGVWNVDDVVWPREDKTGQGVIIVPWPLVELTSVHEQVDGRWGQAADAFGDSTELELGVDFYYRPDDDFRGLIHRTAGCWCNVPGSIKFVMTWGWQMIPRDLDLAVKRLAAIAWAMRSTATPLASESFGDYSYSLLTGTASGDAALSSADVVDIRKTLTDYRLR